MELKTFATNKVLTQELKAYFQAVIDKEALRLLYGGEDAKHIAQAKEFIDRCFSKLIGEHQKPVKQERTNHAR